jgi:NTP pyrophosphatase (non-canonical NTP hydrolase)
MTEKIKKIADHYKLEKQSRQLSEECAELIQATSKYMRYQESSYASTVDWKYLQDICEEIADVEVMLAQIKYLLNINPKAIEEIKKKKIDRQLERIEKECK